MINNTDQVYKFGPTIKNMKVNLKTTNLTGRVRYTMLLGTFTKVSAKMVKLMDLEY